MNEVAKMALTEITEQLELTTRSGYQVKQNICSNNCYENTVRGLNVLVNSLKGDGEPVSYTHLTLPTIYSV